MCLNSDSKLQDNRKMKSPPFIDPLFVQTDFLICDLLFKIFWLFLSKDVCPLCDAVNILVSWQNVRLKWFQWIWVTFKFFYFEVLSYLEWLWRLLYV